MEVGEGGGVKRHIVISEIPRRAMHGHHTHTHTSPQPRTRAHLGNSGNAAEDFGVLGKGRVEVSEDLGQGERRGVAVDDKVRDPVAPPGHGPVLESVVGGGDQEAHNHGPAKVIVLSHKVLVLVGDKKSPVPVDLGQRFLDHIVGGHGMEGRG